VRVPVADDHRPRAAGGTGRAGQGRAWPASGKRPGRPGPARAGVPVPPGQQAPPPAQTLSGVPPRDTTAAQPGNRADRGLLPADSGGGEPIPVQVQHNLQRVRQDLGVGEKRVDGVELGCDLHESIILDVYRRG
jgi:hypothetical protein